MSLTVVTQSNFVADFLQDKCTFNRKRPSCVLSPSGGLGQCMLFILGSLESAGGLLISDK